MYKKRLAHLAFASSLSLAAAAFAQADGPPPRDDNGGPPNREQMQQRFSNMLKEQLGATDEEWAALQPKIDAVRQLKRDASGQMGPPGGPGGGPGGPVVGPAGAVDPMAAVMVAGPMDRLKIAPIRTATTARRATGVIPSAATTSPAPSSRHPAISATPSKTTQPPRKFNPR